MCPHHTWHLSPPSKAKVTAYKTTERFPKELADRIFMIYQIPQNRIRFSWMWMFVKLYSWSKLKQTRSFHNRKHLLIMCIIVGKRMISIRPFIRRKGWMLNLIPPWQWQKKPWPHGRPHSHAQVLDWNGLKCHIGAGPNPDLWVPSNPVQDTPTHSHPPTHRPIAITQGHMDTRALRNALLSLTPPCAIIMEHVDRPPWRSASVIRLISHVGSRRGHHPCVPSWHFTWLAVIWFSMERYVRPFSHYRTGNTLNDTWADLEWKVRSLDWPRLLLRSSAHKLILDVWVANSVVPRWQRMSCGIGISSNLFSPPPTTLAFQNIPYFIFYLFIYFLTSQYEKSEEGLFHDGKN